MRPERACFCFMPNAGVVARRLRELGLPSPPSPLVELVRGKRDRVPPEVKVIAIVVGLTWNEVRADVIADEQDRSRREKAIRVDKINVLREVTEAFENGHDLPTDALGERTHISQQTFLEQSAQISDEEVNKLYNPIYHEQRAVVALLYGEGSLRPAEKHCRMQRHRFIDFEVLSPHSRDISTSEMSAAWDRFEVWKSTLKGGGVSIAAELAGVSRAAASKWLIEFREPLACYNYEEEESNDEDWERAHDEWVRKRQMNPNTSPPKYPPPTFSSQVRGLLYKLYPEIACDQQGD